MRRSVRVAAAVLAVGLAAAPVTAARAAAVPKDEWWFESWGITTDVWPITKGAGVTVAVIDTGVNASLPDLSGAVLPGTDVATSSDDGRQDHDRAEGHGTAMASLIASRGTKSGFMGIAPEAKILPIYSPGVTPDMTSKAIRFAVDHGAKVVNISQGSTSGGMFPNHCPPKLLDAVKYAESKDVVIVASAGNEGGGANAVTYPGSCPGVLAVGAVDHQGRPWAQTQRQDYVTVAAPGAGVGGIGKSGHVYTTGEGTSQASALTAGAVALVRGKNPEMTARQVVQLITNTAKDFGEPGRDDQLGYGVVSITRALKQRVPVDAPNPVYERLDKAAVKPAPGSGASSPKAKEKDSGSALPLVIGGIVVVAVIAVAGVVLLRRRRRPAPPVPGPAYFGGSQGAPPYGAPPQGAPPLQPNRDGMPPPQ
ncbi:type VII secretion-associated serine protease mycosin [Actinomadura roseirufa]|uniref:type VII secretion-associated serine protease mycosin n=1 Tax=Actinomadura roseirufa TaxID=2094049 RepID=UPI0010413D6C|nr:type VII secretion-associated serine protease mycosin [Actinomadura roseirufa]